MKNFEILAPAGAWEQLKAAVVCGANAVYLGAGNFNARRNADNFTTEDLRQAVKYCHLRNVKVYVTLNTLVFDKEADELYETVKGIAESGADAVIVQDFAVVEAVKKVCPEMPLHASTQMAVHNASGAKFLEGLGFSRIVLARELSLGEIKLIRQSVKAELEVFVHGAHCMSASGNCYLSAMLGERSGNRGLCAQGCRLNWRSTHGREYALSLKDMSYLDCIGELCDINIDSFKIEGRMKRPEYVACAVSSLKNAIDGKSYDKNALRSVFSRSGFTDGYLKGKRDLTMFGYRSKEDVTSASNVLKELQSTYKDDIHPLPLEAELTLESGRPATLTLTSQGKTVSAQGVEGEVPRTAPLSKEIAERNIGKLGATSFFLKTFGFNNPDNLTLSASSINAIRRDAVELLEAELTKRIFTVNEAFPEKALPYHPLQKTKTRIRLRSFSQYSDIFSQCEYIILPLEEILRNEELSERLSHKIIAELPSLIYPEAERSVIEKAEKLKALGITRALTDNIGGIKILADLGFIIHGGHGLNITNTPALNFYESRSLRDITLSFELTEKDIKSLGGKIPRGALVYGYLPLMLMRACPQKSNRGCDGCNGLTHLTDRKGIDFPVICRNKAYSVLHNSVPLYIGDKNLNMLDFATLYFTTEDKAQCEKIYEAYTHKKTIDGKKTNGLFGRELL